MNQPLAPRSPAHASRFALSALAAAAAIVAAAPAFAQNTTSGVSGVITGTDGRPVAGATVTIRHTESGSTSSTTTSNDGSYAARGLRTGGPYTITVTKAGATERRDNIFLTLAEVQAVDLTLGTPAATIVVTGRSDASRFSSANVGAGTSLSNRDLNTYASIQRNLQDYARIDPRLSQTDKERGEISAGGQNTRYNSITIDGVTINDTFGLESNNLPTAKQPISIDAIQSVQVNLSNYDVTQKGYTGANINAVTKSGTNELKGSLYYIWRDDNGVGDRFNRQTQTTFQFLPFKEDTVGFTLGGPLIKDKLFFFVNYEELKSNRAQPEFGPAGSELTNVGISNSLINGLRTIAKNQYGFEVGEVMGATKLAVKDTLLKLDWNISDRHRANVRWTKTEQSDTNNGAFGNYSPTSLQLTSQWWQQEKTVETVVAQWFADWTENFSTELKLSKRDYFSVPQNNTRLPAISLSVAGALPADAAAGTNTGTRFLNFGTEQSRHFNVLETATTDAYFGGTWNLGAHEVKFGADLSDNKVYNAFFQNTLGNYQFTCTNSSATFTYSFGAITCASATAAQVEAAILENFSKGRPSQYQVQVPVPGGSLDDGIAKWSLKDTGLFLQDTWKVNKQLTVNFGVRLDTLSTGDRPKFNAAAAAPTVAGNVNAGTGAVTRNTGGFGLDNSISIDGDQLVQPRVGFNYILDPKAERKIQLRGGFGLFQGAAANVWLSNPYSNTGLATRIYGCGIAGFSACGVAGGVFSANPDAQPRLDGNTPAANVDFLAPGFSQPSVWKANFGIDFDISSNLVAGAEVLYTKNKSGVFYKHLNLGAATRLGPDGREMFYTPQGYNSACWTATGGTVTSGTACTGFRNRALSNASFNNVLLASESDKGDGTAVTLSLSRPNRDGWGWNVAWTHTTATEVSPLTSSVANSNFNSRSIYNPNEDVAARSAYLIRNRVSASMSWSKAFFSNYRTNLGVFYEGRTGKTYSWTFRNDLNGDGVAGNDLMYIPSGKGSGEVEFRGDTATSTVNEDRFWSIVDRFAELRGSKGKVVTRNGSTSAWVNNVDLRLSQEVPGFTSKHKGVISFDILNFGNMLNKKWGRINEIGFSSAGGNRRTFVSYGGLNAQGKYVYIVGTAEDDLTLRQVKGESQWAVQVSARYEF